MRLSATAAALLALALGSTAFASRHVPHSLTVSHQRTHPAVHRQAAHHSAHTAATHASAHTARPAKTEVALRRGHAAHGLGTGRQIAQPAASRRLARALERRRRKGVSVVALVRPVSRRPQLEDTAQAATEPLLLPNLRTASGRLIVPAALVGSHEILLRQNQIADEDGLGRVQNDADLDAMLSRGMLLHIPENAALNLDDRLPGNRRAARPWTVNFLADLSRAHYARFHSPLQLTSAVRTVEFQQRLIHHNGNAAPAEGDTASPHLTGQAVDLGKRGMSLSEIAWMRGYLLPLIEAGKVDVEEEFRQSCFHISVYRRYDPPTPDHYAVASRSATAPLATLLR